MNSTTHDKMIMFNKRYDITPAVSCLMQNEQDVKYQKCYD